MARDFIGTIVLKVDPDDPKERLRRAKEIRNRGRDAGAADNKKSAKFVSTTTLYQITIKTPNPKGRLQRIQNGPLHKISTFQGARDCFGPLNGTSDSKGHFRAKKVEGPSKSRVFVQGTILITRL